MALRRKCSRKMSELRREILMEEEDIQLSSIEVNKPNFVQAT